MLSKLNINKAIDYAKNEKKYSEVNKYRYVVDTAAPTIDLKVDGDIEQLFTNNGDVYVKFNVKADEVSGVSASQGAQNITLTATVRDCNLEYRDSENYFNKNYVRGTIDGGDAWMPSQNVIETNDAGSYLVFTKTITVPADASDAICFSLDVQDLVGNKAADFNCTGGYKLETYKDNFEFTDGTVSGTIVGDRERPSSVNDEKTVPVITLNPITGSSNTLDGGVLLYSGSMQYALTVYDPAYTDKNGKQQYSGLETVEWSVSTSQGSLISAPVGYDPDSYRAKQEANFTIPVNINGTGEANDIVLRVTAIDQAGNEIRYDQNLAIDNQTPRVTVSYDNQNFENGKYYKADRNLTLRVEDLNFDPTRTSVTTQPGFSGWSQNGNVYTGTVNYNTDGDYTFSMATSDKANNPATIDYTNGGANTNPEAFTVDKTLPVISVSFDNNANLNGKYYKANRTATVTIDEHNFDTKDIVPSISAFLDGQAISIPAISDWSSSGDKRSATIPFRADGDYSFTVNYTDLAGNKAEELKVDEFTVDTVLPEATITGVEDRTAYPGDITPAIRFYDVNFDPNSYIVKWSLSGLDGTKVLETEAAGSYSEIAHGMVFNMNNLPAELGNDGIYRLSATITDLAGNTYNSNEVMYSVNRFGSVYDVADFPETADLIKDGGQYANQAPTLMIRETNPNVLTSFSISVSANGAARTLEEGKDFEVTKVESDGAWKQYIYKIFDSVFLDGDKLIQGAYNITLFSEDEAGNQNSNRTNLYEDKLDISFTLDDEAASGYMIVAGLAEGRDNIQAAETEITVNWEDNIGLAQVDIYLNDQLYKTLTGEELAEAAGSYIVKATESNELQKIHAVLTDMAGNQSELDPIEFYLNSSAFLQFMRNTPLFVGTIVGIAAAIFLIIFFATKKRKRKNDKTS